MYLLLYIKIIDKNIIKKIKIITKSSYNTTKNLKLIYKLLNKNDIFKI
jgi:hypothetical protein